jgi:hypothetical protein
MTLDPCRAIIACPEMGLFAFLNYSDKIVAETSATRLAKILRIWAFFPVPRCHHDLPNVDFQNVETTPTMSTFYLPPPCRGLVGVWVCRLG